MENKSNNNEVFTDKVGYLARLIDENFSFFERMKIKKTTLKKIFYSLFIYFFLIIFFNFVL